MQDMRMNRQQCWTSKSSVVTVAGNKKQNSFYRIYVRLPYLFQDSYNQCYGNDKINYSKSIRPVDSVNHCLNNCIIL